MGDQQAGGDDFPALMDRLVSGFTAYWQDDTDSPLREEALRAPRAWQRKMRNRKIAAALDKVGLLELARKLKVKLGGA